MNKYKATLQQQSVGIRNSARSAAQEQCAPEERPKILRQLPIHINGMCSDDYARFSYNLKLVLDTINYLGEFPYDILYDFGVHEHLIEKLRKEPIANDDLPNVLNLLSRFVMKHNLDGVDLLMSLHFEETLLYILESQNCENVYQYIFHCLTAMIRYSKEFKEFFLDGNYCKYIFEAEEFMNDLDQKIEMICLIKAIFLPKVRECDLETLQSLFPIIVSYSNIGDIEISRKVFQILRHFINEFPNFSEFVFETNIIQSVNLEFCSDLIFLGSFLYFLRAFCYRSKLGEDIITLGFMNDIAQIIEVNCKFELSNYSTNKLKTILIDINYLFLCYPLCFKTFAKSNLFPLLCKMMFQNSFIISIQCFFVLCNLFVTNDLELIQTAFENGIFNMFEKILDSDEPFAILKVLDSIICLMQVMRDTQNHMIEEYIYQAEWLKEKLDGLNELQNAEISEKLQIIDSFELL